MHKLKLALMVAAVASVALSSWVTPASDAHAAGWTPVSGSGSTSAQKAMDQWRRDVASSSGMTVNYSGIGSSAGRRDFINQTVDFAVSDIPFQPSPEDGDSPEVPVQSYTYLPVVAGGLAFMYNLTVAGQRVTSLNLTGSTIAKIFTGGISNWSDPAVQADNPGLTLPSLPITPVVRSDGNGTTANLTRWLSTTNPQLWDAFCASAGRATPCGPTTLYPVAAGMKAQAGALGVAGYVSQSYGAGAITYVPYSYAMVSGFPVAKLKNTSGHFVAPTDDAVSIGLMGAQFGSGPAAGDRAPDLDGVYSNPDPRAYPLSYYEYLIAPTQLGGIMTTAKGSSLGTFIRYLLCEGQQSASALGNAPLPINLVEAGLARIAGIPGAGGVSTGLAGCANPTFVEGDTGQDNQLLRTASFPADCVPGECHTASFPGPGSITLSVTTIPAVDGLRSLEVDAGATASLSPSGVLNGLRVSRGAIPHLTVQDDRVVSQAGWDLTVNVAEFTNSADQTMKIAPRNLGIHPVLVGNSTGASAAPDQPAGSAAFPAAFASSDAGAGVGSTVLGADLALVSPINAPGGLYESQMTLTLVSR